MVALVTALIVVLVCEKKQIRVKRGLPTPQLRGGYVGKLVDAGYAGHALPVICAAFAPPVQPFLTYFWLINGAAVFGFAGHASEITPLECTSVHVSLLSFHAVPH